MHGYFYFTGADGRRYCYAKQPVFRCPLGDIARQGKDDPSPGNFVVTETIRDGAFYLGGVDPQWLARKLSHSADRERVDGQLTDFCVCGTKLERLGYRYWIEGPPPKNASDEQRVGAALRRRLLGGDGFVQVEGSWYAKTKKDAQAWARMRAGQTRAAA